MPVSGMQMMLRSLGLDPDELRANVEGFMGTMKAAVEKVEANQLRIEGQLQRIEGKLDQIGLDPLVFKESTRPIYEDGRSTGVIITDEKFPRAVYGNAQEFTGVRQGEQADNGR